MTTSDLDEVKRKYRRNARFYNVLGAFQRGHRASAVDLLGLRPGDSVIDVGSGTGLSFDLLEAHVGPGGRIVAVELSPDMMDRARRLAAARRWRNITFLEGAVEDVELPRNLDAAIFFYTHDIMQSPEAVRNVLSALGPGATVVSAGARSPGGLVGRLLAPVARAYSAPFVTNPVNFETPWSVLEDLVGGVQVKFRLMGTAYTAVERVP